MIVFHVRLRIGWGFTICYLNSLEFTLLQILKDLVHLADQGGIASKILQVLIRYYYSSYRLGKID